MGSTHSFAYSKRSESIFRGFVKGTASSFAFTAEGTTKIALCINIAYIDLKEKQI